MKKRLLMLLLAVGVLVSACAAPAAPPVTAGAETAVALPKPGDINAANLTAYLNRPDVLYIDIREYEEYVQGHFRNFELIPFSSWIHAYDAVENKQSIQLFGGAHEKPVPVYKQSDAVLENLFPKDKNLFLVCRSGNRVGALMLILMARGWDPARLYSLGGMVEYENQPVYRSLIVKNTTHQAVAAYKANGLERLSP